MGEVVEEFEETLARIHARHREDPRRELAALLLLAMEREQLVSVAYRDELIHRRLATLSLPADVREIFRHGIAWAWKDEEMHAIYTRGLLLRIGTPWTRGRAVAAQMAGAVAGWASSVQQHARWSQAPIARTLAALTIAAGRLAGKVPRGVSDRLRYLSFRDFCELQVDAECTATRCWERVAALSERVPAISAGVRAEFRRMWEDEESHRRIFALFAAALGPDDRLEPGETAARLVEQARSVGEFFLPRVHRSTALTDHPLGRGGRVWVLAGEPADDKIAVFRALLDRAGLPDRLAARARALGKPIGRLAVVIKPTFMLGCDQRDTAIVTDPVLVEELARYLREQGCGEMVVAEGRNVYDTFLGNRSVCEVARYLGMTSPLYRIADLTDEQIPHTYSRGMAQDTIARTWKDADLRIAFAKMRSHPVDLTHLTIGGLQGVGARLEHFLFAERQAHRDTAILAPLTDFPPHFALIDGYDSAADGLVGIIGCRRPPRPRRLYAGADALAVDMVATRHMDVPDPRRSRILQSACHWFGDPTERIEVVGCDEPVPGWRGPYDNEIWALLSLLAYPVYEFASGRGAAFIPRVDRAAFPPLGPPGLLRRGYGRLIRALVGLR